jgi:toxin ParE1/3/4
MFGPEWPTSTRAVSAILMPGGSVGRVGAIIRARILRITEHAEEDLAEIWAFIAADSPRSTTAFVRRLDESCTHLLDNPLMVPARDELFTGLRVHFFCDYAIYYVPTDSEIIIVRVVHGRWDEAALFTTE